MSLWYFGSLHLIFFQNLNIQQISKIYLSPFWMAPLKPSSINLKAGVVSMQRSAMLNTWNTFSFIKSLWNICQSFFYIIFSNMLFFLKTKLIHYCNCLQQTKRFQTKVLNWYIVLHLWYIQVNHFNKNIKYKFVYLQWHMLVKLSKRNKRHNDTKKYYLKLNQNSVLKIKHKISRNFYNKYKRYKPLIHK